MIKQIRYYQTISPADMNVNIVHLARILFEFSGTIEITHNKKVIYQEFGGKTINVDKTTGFIDFENFNRLNNPNVLKTELPENATEARNKCFEFFRKKDKELQEDEDLQIAKFPSLFRGLHFVNAFKVEHKNLPRIDHWECHFNIQLLLNRTDKATLRNAYVILKLCNNGDVIGFRYCYLPFISFDLEDKIETKKYKSLFAIYQNKIKQLEETQNRIINSIERLDKEIKKEDIPIKDLIYNEIINMKDIIDEDFKTAGYYHTVSALNSEIRNFEKEIEKIKNQEIVYLYDFENNLILPYYSIINKESNEELLKPATKYEIIKNNKSKNVFNLNGLQNILNDYNVKEGSRLFFVAGAGNDQIGWNYVERFRIIFTDNGISGFMRLNVSNDTPEAQKAGLPPLGDLLFTMAYREEAWFTVYKYTDNLLGSTNREDFVYKRIANINPLIYKAVEAIYKHIQTYPLIEGEQLNLVGYSYGSVFQAHVALALADMFITINHLILIGSPVSKNSNLYKELTNHEYIKNVIREDIEDDLLSDPNSIIDVIFGGFNSFNEAGKHFDLARPDNLQTKENEAKEVDKRIEILAQKLIKLGVK